MAQDGLVWVNGTLTDYSEAHVALEDRGFLFGDGVYEVVRAYGGKPFMLREHLARFERSARGIELDFPMDTAEWTRLVHELLAKSGLADAEVYMQITRGAGRRNHLFPENTPPTVVMGVRGIRPMDESLWQQGAKAVTAADQRWARCDLKTICLLPNVLAKQQAHRQGALEAILIRDGLVTEGSSSNVFVVREGEVATARADNRILNGITRVLVLTLAREMGYMVNERDIREGELAQADEIFFTSTRMEIMPVSRLNGEPVGDGRPGEVVGTLLRAFQERVDASREVQA